MCFACAHLGAFRVAQIWLQTPLKQGNGNCAMTFWLIAGALSLFVAGILIWPLVCRQTQTVETAENLDLQVYRDQLAEVESDLAKGVLSEDEAERTRLEVSRRILDADEAQGDAAKSVLAGRSLSLAAAAGTSLVLLLGTVAVYWQIGANGLPDLPRAKRNAQMAEAQASRPPQAQAEASVGDDSDVADQAEQSYKDLVAELRDTVAKRPDDLRGHELLANHEARLGRFAAARLAKGRAIEIKGTENTTDDYTDWAELMIIAAGGYVSPLAETALGNAIKIDPTNPRARYYSGLDLAQNGRPDLALRLWSDLLREGPPEAPWIGPIRAQIADVARLAGAPAPDLPDLPGPDAEQIEDAQNLSAEERQEMIRGMVQQLSARLATQGGNASEWARLIQAYGVLGETDRAAAIWGEAQSVFAADPIAIDELLDAARAAGITQ
jgi:cytochrome c-type biogenesis protein CcmH